MRTALRLTSLWIGIACLVPPAAAQEIDAGHYDGGWTVRFKCPDGTACTARMVLKDFEGSWQDVRGSRASKSVCGGRKIPLSVQSSKLAHLAFTAWGESVRPGCPTLSIFVKPVSAKLLEGSYDVGVQETERAEVHASHSKAAPSGRPADTPSAKPVSPAVKVDPGRAIRLERR